MIRVLLCRHGETDWNREHRMQGHTDVPLAESGRQQARRTGAFVRAQNPGAGHVSSLVRTQQTYEQFGLDAGAGLTQPRIWDGLREQNLGVWEGSFVAEISRRHAEEFARWRAGDYAPDGGETQQALARRMVDSFTEIVRGAAATEPTPSPDLRDPVPTAVVVSHGAALRVLLESLDLIDRSRLIPLTPASVTVVDVLHTLAPPDAPDLADAADLTEDAVRQAVRLRALNLSPELLPHP